MCRSLHSWAASLPFKKCLYFNRDSYNIVCLKAVFRFASAKWYKQPSPTEGEKQCMKTSTTFFLPGTVVILPQPLVLLSVHLKMELRKGWWTGAVTALCPMQPITAVLDITHGWGAAFFFLMSSPELLVFISFSALPYWKIQQNNWQQGKMLPVSMS